MESVDASENLKMLKMQINEFGQVPKQLFKAPHPKRFSNGITELASPMILEQTETKNEPEVKNEDKKVIKEKQKEEPFHKPEETIPKTESSQQIQKEKNNKKLPSHESSIINESFFLRKKYNLIEKHHKT